MSALVVRVAVCCLIEVVGHELAVIIDIYEVFVLYHLQSGARIVCYGIAHHIAKVVRGKQHREVFLTARGRDRYVFNMHSGSGLGLHRQRGIAKAALFGYVLRHVYGKPIGEHLVARCQRKRVFIRFGSYPALIHRKRQR